MRYLTLIVSSLTLGAACASVETSASTAPPISRREDPQPYLPPPTEGPPRSGATLGVTAVVPQDDVRAAALTFMSAFVDEDIETMLGFVGENFSLGTTGRMLPRRVLEEAWRRQFSILDYTQFSLDEAIDRESMEVIPFEEHQTGPRGTQWLTEGDVLVRLRMRVTTRNRRRYFDNPTELWFRQVGGRWQIVALGR